LSLIFGLIKVKIAFKLIFTLLASSLTFGAIYLTYSRGAFIMLVVGLLSFLWLKGKRKVLIIIFIILVALIFIAPKSFKLEGTNFLRIVSTQGRIANMQQGLDVFWKSPVIGVGFNSYRYALNRYFGVNNSIWETTHAGAGNDNSYIFVLATTGIVGFSAFVFLILKMLMLGREKFKNEYAILFISVFLGLLVNSLFTNTLFYVLILEWIWIFAGLTESS
jgi:O-antigen ligase